jgi:predicted DNA repair protein MutK
MPSASLLVLLDDIATVLDDVAALSKVAAKKTAGVLGDDLALNAEQVAGVRAERELPVVWAVAKGSLLNKAILVPGALLISAIAPWLVLPLLMLGGLYLAFEGFEKVWHAAFPHPEEDESHHAELTAALVNPHVDLLAVERDKIRGAIRTDFILSAEIVTITLGSVADAPLVTRFSVLAAVAVLLTIGVYGLVAAIVKMDDVGLALSRMPGHGAVARGLRQLGHALFHAAPRLMKLLTLLGTAAMFLVGGGILVHGLPPLHHVSEHWQSLAPSPWLGGIVSLLVDALAGIVAGGLAVLGASLLQRLRR